MPEDASWAVSAEESPQLRPHHAVGSCRCHQFPTRSQTALRCTRTLRLTVRDLAGNIVEQDAQPIYYDGPAFRVYKTMPLDEHYYGLGDRTGPLDRRDESFTLWITDAYRFQESTNLIHAIPFFITFRAGVRRRIFLDNTWRTSFDFGKQLPNVYLFLDLTAYSIDYILTGPTPKEVVDECYTWLTGTPPLPSLRTSTPAVPLLPPPRIAAP